MTKLAGLIIAVLLACAGRAFADGPGITEEMCRSLPPATSMLVAGSAEPVGRDGCEYRTLRLSLMANQSWTIDRVLVTRLDAASLAGGASVPLTLRVEAQGIRFSPTVANKVVAYTIRTSARPFDMTLDYDVPAAVGIAHLTELSMRGRNVGDVHLSAQIAGVTPQMLQTLDPAAPVPAGLKSLKLHLNNQGFVESYMLSMLAPLFLQGSEDPEATVEQLKRQAIAVLRGTLASTATDPATIDALAGFIADFPHPAKILDVALDLPRPLGLAEAQTLQEGKLAPSDLLPAGALVATYRAP